MVIGLTHRQWRGLVKVTGLGEEIAALGQRLGLDLDLEGDRWAAREEITAVLAPWFAERRVDEVGAALDAASCTWSAFRSFTEAVRQDPDLSPENPMFSMVEQPGIGSYPVPGTPFAFSGSEREPPRPAPLLGQHTEEILADVLGLGGREIGELFDARVVAGPKPVD